MGHLFDRGGHVPGPRPDKGQHMTPMSVHPSISSTPPRTGTIWGSPEEFERNRQALIDEVYNPEKRIARTRRPERRRLFRRSPIERISAALWRHTAARRAERVDDLARRLAVAQAAEVKIRDAVRRFHESDDVHGATILLIERIEGALAMLDAGSEA